jgi:hypothetical protein
MARLSRAETRRLIRYLRSQSADLLAELEGELSGEDGEEFLREPELLKHFPGLAVEVTIATAPWRLRIIPHAHLRMVQRGFKLEAIIRLFTRVVETCVAAGEQIIAGPYTIVERPQPRDAGFTLRVDVDVVTEAGGQAHVVTIFMGLSSAVDAIEIAPM